jgi:ACS family glucarate transporter-like MFS transporter
VFTALQGFAGLLGGISIVGSLFILRLLVGLAEAPAFPGNARVVAAWFPGTERGLASAIFNSSQYFALVAFAPLMSWLVQGFGWRVCFFTMGMLGVIAATLFARFICSPARHPRVNAAELQLISAGGGLVNMDDAGATKISTPFRWSNLRLLLSNRMLLGIYLGQYGINVLTYFFVTWFPIYLVKDRGLDIMHAGFATALPALCGFAGGLLGGFVSDRLLARTKSLDVARKTPILFGMLLASAIIACVYVRDEKLIIILMSIAFFGKGVASLGWAVISDVAPRTMIGQAGGVFNMFGNMAGIVTPIVIGYLITPKGSFDAALLFVGAHCLLVVVAYFVIAGRIQRVSFAE